MNLTEFLHGLSLKNVDLWVEDDKLRYRAPTGVLAAEQLQTLKRYKSEIIGHLSQPHLDTFSKEPTKMPLSYIQEGVWYTEQLQPGLATYNIPSAFRLRGRLNVTALEKSLAHIIQRHETLRSCFIAFEGEPKQVIHPNIKFSLNHLNISSRSTDEQEAKLTKLLLDEAHAPFDLEQPPLLRATLISLADNDYVLSLTLHHLIADGWSLRMLLNELATCYASFIKDEASPHLAELPIQYSDFTDWQRARFEGKELENQLSFWRDRLDDDPAPLQLPTDHTRPMKPTYVGRTHTITLPSTLVAGLKDFGKKENSTLFMTLLAAYKVLLFRYSQQDDILVGTPVANRSSLETEPLIGYLANTLVLRTDLSGNPTFRELLKRVRRMALDTFAHQDLPFEKLVKELNPTRNVTHTPYFQTMLVHQNFQPQSLNLKDMLVESCPIERQTAKFDLTLTVTDKNEALAVVFEYSTELFEAKTVERMANHWQRLLAEVATNPDQSIGNIEFLSEVERLQILQDWNSTSHAFPVQQTISERFENQVEQTPTAIAVSFENESLTYSTLNQRANQLAYYLRECGTQPGDLIGLCLDRSPNMIVGILGVLKAGAAYLPLDPSMPTPRMKFILQDAKISILLTQQSLAETLSDFTGHMIQLDLDQAPIASYSTSNLALKTDPNDLAYVIYTSGSTGKPKGALVSQVNVVRLFSATEAWYNFNSDDVWSLFHSYAFDFSVWEIWGALLYGGRLVIVPYWVSRSPNEFFQLLIDEGVTVLNQTPSAFRQLIQAGTQTSTDPRKELALRYVIFGGEALEMRSLKPWFDRHGDQNPQLINMYGITETTVHVTHRPLSKADLDSASLIGRPIPDLQLYILDQFHQLVPIGVPGEMYVGGAGVTGGYLNRPKLTAERFLQNPISGQPSAQLYKTGDLARYLPNGDIEYLGRIDHQIQLRGFRIELGEIESTLIQHPSVQEVAVIAREDTPDDKRLVAYIVPADTNPLSAKAWRSELQNKLPDYMIPSAYVILDHLPLTLNGKLDRRALPIPSASSSSADLSTFMAPRNPIENQLATIWQNVLNIERVSVNDNFFDLGGHSLLVTKIVSRITQTFNVTLPLTTFFESPTIADISEVIQLLEQMAEW